MKEIVVKAENLGFSYEEDSGKLKVLENINIEIEKGSFVAVLGHNGSGKSTLAKLFNLILTPTEGKLYLFGKEADGAKMTPDEIFGLRRRVGMVFQNPDNQLIATIVEEDVAFGPENLGLPPAEIRKRVDGALEQTGLSAFAKHSPHQLSGGQKQRVAIAGIIALMPEIIILDEATAMLDPSGRREVLDTVKRLNREKGITVIHITHYMEEAAEADRVIVLDDGKLILDSDPRNVFTETEKVKSAGLDVPQVTEIVQKLAGEGMALRRDALTPVEGAESIDAYLKSLRQK